VADRPLVGVRVLELATDVPGPYGGKLLADLGADVVKAEPPSGDTSRARGPFRDGVVDAEASGFYLYLNAGKRGITLDLERPTGFDALLDLVEHFDVLLESYEPAERARLGLDIDALRARNPLLVVVSVTPFGQWGPRSHWTGNDMIAFHSSGFAYGYPSREIASADLPPLNAPSHASSFLAGEMVAGAAVHGLLAAQRTGHGSHADVSLQEAVGAENQAQHNAAERAEHESGGYGGGNGGVSRRVTDVSSNAIVSLLPCRDGWVVISPREEHQWARWLEVMGSPAWAADPRFADRKARQQHWQELYPLLTEWSRQHSKTDIFEAAQSRRVACYPLGTATDLLQSRQFAARGFFVEQEHPELGTLVFPGVPYDLSGTERPRPGLAPRLGQHNGEVFGGLLGYADVRVAEATGAVATSARVAVGAAVGSASTFALESNGTHARGAVARTTTTNGSVGGHGRAPGADESTVKPLACVRIVDFSWVMAGPICTKYLAAMGAEVIKIESNARPDLSHRDVSWEELNPSKRSITLNLKDERARDLVRRLIAASDIVIENFSTGVMERLGLGYQALREINPRIIMASASGFGRTGPDRDLVAYGSLLQCFTGWASLSAYPGRAPSSVGGIWTDPLTACMEAFLLLSAVWRQHRTGEGCFYDVSMSETMVAALPEPIIAWAIDRTITEPRGNRHPLVAPQGCYPTRGDGRWIALSIRDDDEWRTFCKLLGRDDLAADAGLATAEGRRARHDELDAAIAEWTRTRDAGHVAEQLQAAGIAATPTLTALDILSDEHLAARSFVSQVERLAGGMRHTLGSPWMIDGTRPNSFRRAPRVGEDNDYVFKEILGLDADEYARLMAEQVIF